NARRPRPLLLERLEGRVVPGLLAPLAFDAAATSVVVADLNGDGRLDLAAVHNRGSLVHALLGNGDGSFQPARSFATGADPTAAAVGEFNGDGPPPSLLPPAGGRTCCWATATAPSSPRATSAEENSAPWPSATSTTTADSTSSRPATP